MRKLFFKGIIKHRKAVIVLFVLAAAVCALCKPLVGVNYDLNDYLPEGVASTEAIDVMDAQFDEGIPNMRVMVRDVDVEEALAYKDAIAAVAGVDDVMWLDDAVDIREPLEMQDADTVETYYKDSAALFSVTVAEGHEVEAVDGVRAVIGDDNAMDGAAVSTAVATTGTVAEINLVTAVAIVIILLVLVLTTQSWLEPVLIMAGLGVAVLINSGTNLVFGEISFVTNAAGAILQIAISLDFAVFFLHRFHECRGTTGSTGADIVSALCKSSTAIFTSGLAITFGFLSLSVMQFRIGPDLGLALAKGMVISLLTVFTFVPALFATCNAAVDKTRHRPFIGSLRPLGNLVAHVMVPLACLFALLCAPAYLASNSEDISYWYGASHIYGSDTKVGQDTDAIVGLFGESDTYALLVPRGDVATEKALSDALKALPQVKSVVSYVDVAGATVPPEMASASELERVESADYSRLVVTVEVPYEGEQTFGLVDQIRDLAQRYYPDTYYLAGQGVSTTDLMLTISQDKDLVDMVAIGAVLVVLLIATRSLVLPIILVFVIETAIWFNFAVPYFTGSPVFYLSYLIASTILLGVTVDYAILFADRYKEFRRTLTKGQAVRATIEVATVPVMTSGTVVAVVAGLLGAFSTHGLLSQLGWFLCTGVLMSLAAVIFVLPGYLWLFDGIIGMTTRHANFCSNHPDHEIDADAIVLSELEPAPQAAGPIAVTSGGDGHADSPAGTSAGSPATEHAASPEAEHAGSPEADRATQPTTHETTTPEEGTNR